MGIDDGKPTKHRNIMCGGEVIVETTESLTRVTGICPVCTGTGRAMGPNVGICPRCGGVGIVIQASPAAPATD